MNARLPAEWEPQEAVWFVWPRDPQTWPGDHLGKARAAYREAVEAVAAHQPVHLVVHPEVDAPDVEGRVTIHRVAHQDSWIRDYGPLTVQGGGTRHLKFRFDAWGGKYESLLMDDGTVARLQETGAFPDGIETIDFVLEGGAVETDGQGTFLATESVAAGRGQTPQEHEQALRTYLGARKVIWLADGIQGDDTDGHIDTITRFVAPGRVVTAYAPRGHPDHESLAANRLRLKGAKDASGRRLHVIDLPVPKPRTTDDGTPLPAGYANFLITNQCVLVPTYGDPADAEAHGVLRGCFPGRRIVPIDHRDLIWGFGGIHCLSMHVARVTA